MDANVCKTKENIHNNKRKLKITWEKNYLHHIHIFMSKMVTYALRNRIADKLRDDAGNANKNISWK